MCNCASHVTTGSYANQVTCDVPDTVTLRMNDPELTIRTTVCIDTCIVDEIKSLWARGIVTTGCCCGHNMPHMAYIGSVSV